MPTSFHHPNQYPDHFIIAAGQSKVNQANKSNESKTLDEVGIGRKWSVNWS